MSTQVRTAKDGGLVLDNGITERECCRLQLDWWVEQNVVHQDFVDRYATLLQDASDAPIDIAGGRLGRIIVPANHLTLNERAMLITVNGRRAAVLLNTGRLGDEVETPESPYALDDVEDGSRVLGLNPRDARLEFREIGRSGLTATEGLVIGALFPWKLRQRFIDLPGSACGADVPVLGIWGGTPALSFLNTTSPASAIEGSASCAARLRS